ncbi:DUF4397 domain-containing protein [Nakamurella antarctica]|uniref:DUF4397 domain-containing protein n=1 Tax=Nakamurella antarctica TaxID=1902245 RepID=A0A3G8ZQJ7_9ACTN|nr:DUF4397 domain-containing protein [Nakamurella antarctica]AZI59077.1 DUF4397 domain-containing protein [Nakamurella antarctica]
MKKLVAVAGACALGLATTLLGAGSASAADTGTVYVVHGIPGLPVDVYVDGARALDDFAPLTVAGPLELPSGAHKIVIVAAADADASKPLLSADATVPAGGNVSLVAHLDADGKPTVTPFVNDVSAVAAGQARLVVRHTAAAPAVDVRAGGKVVLPGVTNPQQGALVVPAGTVSADVALAGTDTVAIGPADLKLAEGTATFVHAVGSAADKTLGLVSFTVTGLHSSPAGVPAGNGPADSPWSMIVLITMVAAGGLLVTVGGRRLVTSTSTN